MKLDCITLGPFEVNGLLLWTESKQALVVDPGDDADKIRRALQTQGLTVSAYLLTHGHVDHISALHDLAQTHPAPAYMHPADSTWAFSAQNMLLPYYNVPKKPTTTIHDLKEGQKMTLSDLSIQVIHTPGHSPGSVCFFLPNQQCLLAGDTLFKQSAGRTDLPGGNARQLTASLARLAQLPGSTTVYPGHGPKTTIEHERRTNYFMSGNSA